MKAHSFLIFLCLTILCTACQTRSRQNQTDNDKIPLLVFTDFGRDVDDAEAFAYIAKNDSFNLAVVVCCGYIPECRAKSLSLFLQLLGTKAPVAVGSALPLGVTDSTFITKYLAEHSLDGKPYEYSLLESMEKAAGVPQSLTAINTDCLIDSLLNRYKGRLRMVVLSQATDAARYFSRHTGRTSDLHSVYIQGQAVADSMSGKLLPDEAAYNLKEDMNAAEILFSLQDSVPFIFLGKYAAYPMAYSTEEFLQMSQHNGEAGKYLYQAAEKGLECFAQRDSSTFYRVFGLPPSVPLAEAVKQSGKLSNPYDLLTVIAIDKPELFNSYKVGKHTFIGVRKEDNPIAEPKVLKELILGL